MGPAVREELEERKRVLRESKEKAPIHSGDGGAGYIESAASQPMRIIFAGIGVTAVKPRSTALVPTLWIKIV